MPAQETDPSGIRVAPEDRRLIKAYLAGDPDAVAEVERWIAAELNTRFPALASRIEEREDLCQTLHARLLVNLREERFRHRSTLKTYVARITRYAAIDRLRYRSRRPELPVPEGALSLVHDDDPEQAAQRQDRRRNILGALRRSPERCRELWRMIFVDSLDYREIALRLGVPVGTVKSRAWTCRQRLRELLEESDRQDGPDPAEPPPSPNDRAPRKDTAP